MGKTHNRPPLSILKSRIRKKHIGKPEEGIKLLSVRQE